MTTGDEQGVNEIMRAANDAVAAHLDAFQDSVSEQQLWEDHPELLESEADKAVIQANLIAATLLDMLRTLAPVNPAMYQDEGPT